MNYSPENDKTNLLDDIEEGSRKLAKEVAIEVLEVAVEALENPVVRLAVMPVIAIPLGLTVMGHMCASAMTGNDPLSAWWLSE
jgi:hypothetical protein